MDDICKEILLNIDRDIKQLVNSCSIDRLSRTICSNISYWNKAVAQSNV